MYLKIQNKIITTPVDIILSQVRKELTNGKLKDIKDTHKRNILITCPHHKDGFESNPSCQVFNDIEDPDLEIGFAHCFTCGYSAPLPKVIGDLFGENEEFGKEWLISRYANVFIQQEEYLPPIELTIPKTNIKTIDEQELIQYDFYHPYMWTRGLSKSVVDQFRIGYDKQREAITFPVYDEKHRLVMITARSVLTKRFYIPEDVNKPVYLLFDLIERGCTNAVVCESQINTLYMRSLFPNIPSIGLFGTGSKTQLETLKKSGIRNYILCFDGDEAGRKGAARFKQKLGDSVFITDIILPPYKDVNDLSKDQLIQLFYNQGVDLTKFHS